MKTIEVEAALDIVSSSEVCLGRPERQGDIMESQDTWVNYLNCRRT